MSFSAQLLWFIFSQHLLIHPQEPITAIYEKSSQNPQNWYANIAFNLQIICNKKNTKEFILHIACRNYSST